MRISQLFVAAVSASVLSASFVGNAHAILTAGDIAIIGRDTNGTPTDSFVIAPLVNLTAGEVIYFTDNGWTGTQYRGASATDGDGNENLIRLTINSAISAGTVINSTATGTAFTFTTSGLVGGTTTSGSFAQLSLGQSGEQIYAFQGPAANPLLNPTVNLFAFDDTGAFENATDSSTGGVAPGLTAGTTALTFTFSGAAPTVYGLDTTLPGYSTPKTKSQWLTYISTPGNYSTTALPATNFTVSAAAVPEAGTFGLLALALPVIGAVVLRRRK